MSEPQVIEERVAKLRGWRRRVRTRLAATPGLTEEPGFDGGIKGTITVRVDAPPSGAEEER